MSKNESKDIRDGFMKHSKSSSILPPPSMLESYEEIAPGIVEKLVELVEKEQRHRHIVEAKNAKYQFMLDRLYPLIAKALFIIPILIITFISSLIAKTSIISAAIICCTSCISLVIINKKLANGKSTTGAENANKNYKSHYQKNKRRFYQKNS